MTNTGSWIVRSEFIDMHVIKKNTTLSSDRWQDLNSFTVAAICSVGSLDWREMHS